MIWLDWVPRQYCINVRNLSFYNKSVLLHLLKQEGAILFIWINFVKSPEKWISSETNGRHLHTEKSSSNRREQSGQSRSPFYVMVLQRWLIYLIRLNVRSRVSVTNSSEITGSRNVFHLCLVFHGLVEHLIDYFNESGITGIDFKIIYRSLSWLANETKKFDDDRAWDSPVSL